jgi:hypothetical protein
VEGGIDHLAVDVPCHRLFPAALGNNTLEVIDLRAGKVIHSIKGLANLKESLSSTRTSRSPKSQRLRGRALRCLFPRSGGFIDKQAPEARVFEAK